MHGQYDRFRAIWEYHNAVAQLFWAIDQSITNYPDDDYVVQCVREVLATHQRMSVTGGVVAIVNQRVVWTDVSLSVAHVWEDQ